MDLQANKERVYAAVAEACRSCDRDPGEVTVVAVTKYVDIPTTEELISTGIRHLGENRVDKFLDKYRYFQGQDLVWHYIGSLQRRKVKEIINLVDYFHALDSLSLAQEIQKRAIKPIKCFIQVNVSGEASKHGFSPEELLQVLDDLAQLDKIEVVGLMTMAPFEASSSHLEAIFAQTNDLKEKIREKALKTMPITALSMGMSGDFPQAIAQGATHVRIGSSFFD